jgi:bacterioferritin-associated ferredoxin
LIVCSCNVLSDKTIRASVQGETGAGTPGAVYRCLGCSPKCGRCYATVQSLIHDALKEAGEQCPAACTRCCGGAKLP